MTTTEKPLVSLVDISELAGVTRAAVSNWRRRYPDFPDRIEGTALAPLFSLSEVKEWLRRTGRGRDVSDEVGLWQELRAQFGDDMVAGFAAVGRELRDTGEGGLSTAATTLVRQLAKDRGPLELLSDLATRYAGSVGRSSGEIVSTPLLVSVITQLAGDPQGGVLDPACGQGDLLLAVGGRNTERSGQDVRPSAIEFVTHRAALADEPLTARVGDTLRDDRFPGVQAQLVVCDPPRTLTDWGREDLLVDTRWEFGIPPKSEGELAWLQHCFAHTAPGGRAIVALPSAVAYRRSGKKIRTEMVRNGYIEAIVQLPAGAVAGSPLPIHLWVLRRTPSDEGVRMLDLTDENGDIDMASAWEHAVIVSAVALLDDEVDLTPARYVGPHGGDNESEYATARMEFDRLLSELTDALPHLAPAPGWERSMALDVGELIRHGLVSVDEDTLTSHTDQIDADFLRGFIRSASNTRRNTSSSGSFRIDSRAAKVPQLDAETQRTYGAIFRQLEAVQHAAERLAKLARNATRRAHDGLTSGNLKPVTDEENR
ncbi:N-6 DNA methylase [Nocardia sp. CA-135398]|uniref:N-6 DNA methylase n=1 Tax=Nocardia sp. CA-135398 TaxID=3239977 RepID=UPI003D967465